MIKTFFALVLIFAMTNAGPVCGVTAYGACMATCLASCAVASMFTFGTTAPGCITCAGVCGAVGTAATVTPTP